MHPCKADRPGAGGDVPELILTAPEGYSVEGVAAADSRHEGAGTMGQYGTLKFSHHHIVEYGEVGIQVELAAPENNRSGEVEVQPELEFVVGDSGYVGAADVDRKIVIGTEDDQRIGSGAIGVDLVS